MKKIILVSLAAILFFACKKDNSNGANIPQWLKDKIAVSEANIKYSIKGADALGAWYEYKFEGDIYYHYNNMIFSSMGHVYNRAGQEFNIYESQQTFQKYMNNRCCKILIWKGPQFPENF